MWMLLLAVLGADEVPRRASPLTPQEIVKRLDASSRTYKVNEEHAPPPDWYQDNAAGFWPTERDRNVAVPVLSKADDGTPTVVEWQAPTGSGDAMAKAQAVFHSKDWPAAEKAFGEVVAKFPAHYFAWLSWGETAEFQGHAKVALERYEKASKLVPLDVQGWLHRGGALLSLGQRAEAIKAYAHALALRPHDASVAEAVAKQRKRLGVTVRTDLFLPAARTEEQGGDVLMSLVAQPHWVAWDSCKSLWLGEESHRVEMTGRKDHVFSNVEEEECLINLAASYETVTKAKAGFVPDPTAQLVYDVMKAGMVTAFVLYELGSRIDRQLTMLLSENQFHDVEELVRRFVLVPK